MLEVARIMASIAAILLIGAFVAWASPLGRPPLPRPKGSAVANGVNIQIAALLLLASVGVSAAAAILAIAGLLAT